MECMRALIENDRQVEGCFTSYNAALSRSALKKDRFLNGKRRRGPAAAARSGGRPPRKRPGLLFRRASRGAPVICP